VLFERFALKYQVYFKAIKDHERPAAIIRMRELLINRKQYSELGFNCEHAKNYVTKGKAYSIQSSVCIMLAVAGAFAFIGSTKMA